MLHSVLFSLLLESGGMDEMQIVEKERAMSFIDGHKPVILGPLLLTLCLSLLLCQMVQK